VAWEERVLAASFGQRYDDYRQNVPAWIPSVRPHRQASEDRFRRRIAYQSGRNTLRAIVLVSAALVLKHLFLHDQVAGAVRASPRARRAIR